MGGGHGGSGGQKQQRPAMGPQEQAGLGVHGLVDAGSGDCVRRKWADEPGCGVDVGCGADRLDRHHGSRKSASSEERGVAYIQKVDLSFGAGRGH